MTRVPISSVILAAILLAAGSSRAGAQNTAPASPAASASPPATAPASTLAARIEPKAQQILDRTIQALGGAAFLNFKTITTHGRLFSLGAGGEGFVYFDNQTEFPDKRRLAYGLAAKKAKPIIVINNGDLGWEIDRMGMVHLNSADVVQWKFVNRYSLENLLRLRIYEPGTLVQTAGVDFVSNRSVDILEIEDAQQTQIRLCLDKQTALPVEVWYRKWNATANDWDEYADDYADFRSFQGIMTAMHITRTLNGRRFSELYRGQVEYNETYPPKLFEDPGATG